MGGGSNKKGTSSRNKITHFFTPTPVVETIEKPLSESEIPSPGASCPQKERESQDTLQDPVLKASRRKTQNEENFCEEPTSSVGFGRDGDALSVNVYTRIAFHTALH